MGLAAKLAAAQADSGQYARPPGPPPSTAVGAAVPAPPPSQPSQPKSDPTKDVSMILRILEEGVKDQQNLAAFYPQGSLLPIAQKIATSGALSQIAQSWKLPLEIAMDFARLALFDCILYLDDSASMAFKQWQGARLDELKMIVGHIATAAGLFDTDGINVRWMNSKKEGNGFTTEAQALELIGRVKFDRGTPLGTALHEKVLEPLVHKPAKKGKLKKPVLIVCATDGAPTGEPRDTIIKVIKESKKLLDKTPYTADAVSFQLAQIGDDQGCREFMEYIDEEPTVGSLVDTTSNFENEQDNFSKANPPVHLTREMWLAKLILGPIHSGWDAADEQK
ncbi:hypothetical protein JCM11641_001458 [Rhodosporidiobolus odoratus]